MSLNFPDNTDDSFNPRPSRADERAEEDSTEECHRVSLYNVMLSLVMYWDEEDEEYPHKPGQGLISPGEPRASPPWVL